MEQENRLKITVWLKPDVVQRMDGWLRADNCKSRGEFTEKALRFYMGYLAAEDTSVFLSRTLVDTLQGIVADSHNRIRRYPDCVRSALEKPDSKTRDKINPSLIYVRFGSARSPSGEWVLFLLGVR